jgi:hypothetical protein
MGPGVHTSGLGVQARLREAVHPTELRQSVNIPEISLANEKLYSEYITAFDSLKLGKLADRLVKGLYRCYGLGIGQVVSIMILKHSRFRLK